ncbi:MULTISPECIES: YdcF family protein [unclassified Corynebacterium]|uniref:YdcF family protein n=1 Tax=unclassified Corynebacterium TaxID=2624378 RepID=UPI0021682520|nr:MULTISPECIES: YdcF family protein [unclassified Corynebacterium]MCS4492373.1 YdcF family protein [Corynebacterium sp. ES2715-CONJ3]MCS4532435.1 YdcF family protein [Corynebacterium sp. ES2730-CONJ]
MFRLVLLPPFFLGLTIWSYGVLRTGSVPHTHAPFLVLGAAQKEGRPSPIFAQRLKWAAELHQRDRNQEIMTVGGKMPGESHSEADVGRQTLEEMGVAADKIRVIASGHDTRGSLIDVAAMCPPPWIVITHPSHALRVRLLGELEGFDFQLSPTPYHSGVVKVGPLIHEMGGVTVLAVERFISPRLAKVVQRWLRRLQAYFTPHRLARAKLLEKALE